MNSSFTPQWAGLLVLLLLVTGCGAAGAATPESSPYQVSVDKGTDTVTVTPGAGEVVFDITSKTGMGRAEISRADGAWPERVEVRLHLPGLESLTVTYGDVEVHTAVPSTAEKFVDQTVLLPGQNAPTRTLDTRYEMALTVVDADGQTDIPLDDGYFAVLLPLDFREGGYTSFTIDWLDFYR
ncbi:MAG: hypothetical protein H6659_19490 [Ardenticatenaceae bacterium]|nr:hypothetical protein [Ardenticatenaceae bacterium]